MRLLSKLTLSITLSKLAIVGLFVYILPFLIEKIASEYTDYYLRQQKNKVLSAIAQNGVDFYLEGEESFGSYTMLKEEYISLEPYAARRIDTIETSQRLIEQDTLNYRVLRSTFQAAGASYLLEVGKTVATISQYNKPLQRIALYVLMGLIGLTLIADLLYTRFLLKPLQRIIETKLVHQQFPFRSHAQPVNTSTLDFKYLDDTLISLMDQVNEAFEKEREFTANASHELMTPISILKSKIENLLLHENTSEEMQVQLSELMRTVDRLKKIVQSLLLISRIENEQFVRAENVDIAGLVREVTEEISYRLEEKGLQLQCSSLQNYTVKAANRDLLFQLLYNLLNNAIKYNVEGGSISISGSEQANGSYRLLIQDSGIGIPGDDLPLIFNRFKKSNLSHGAGYGLGLAIVKSIADYHGVQIDAESEVGLGTRISLIFPSENKADPGPNHPITDT